MQQIAEGSSIKRELRIVGFSKPVQAEVTAVGIRFWIKGNRKRVHASWKQIIQAGVTGTDVPSYLMGKPLELLLYQITKGHKLP
jgi:hypothetical protein